MNVGLVSGVLWCVFAVEIAGLIAVGAFLERSMHGPSGGGGVGAFLLLFPAIALCACAVTFLATNSIGVRTVCLVFMAMPILFVGVGEAKTWADKRSSGPRYEAMPGQDRFPTPELKALGAAIYSSNAERVKQILPTINNLNQPLTDNTTVLSYAVGYVYSPIPARLEIVRLLLKAGADPNPPGVSLVEIAMKKTDDDLLRVLLEAGANPNALDDGGHPVWWKTLKPGYWYMDRFRMLLNHSADVKFRVEQQGPVSLAVSSGKWAHAVLLIERGADWKQEKLDTDQLVSERVLQEYKDAESSRNEIPEDLRKLKQMYEAAR
jgi:hypothetical protein